MNINFRISGNSVILEDPDNFYRSQVEIWSCKPVIGEKYMVVFFCDYDNSEYGNNYPIEITEENIAEITFHMNDLENDITEYILIEQ